MCVFRCLISFVFLLCRDEKSAITFYYHQGFSYAVILQFLAIYQRIVISLRALKRRLRDYGLMTESASAAVNAAIECELQGPGKRKVPE